MKANPIKAKLRCGESTFGTWLSLGNLLATRTLARSGFDWLTVDMEHQAIDYGLAATLMAAIADAGCVPLARVPLGSHAAIKRALDAGAWGIVVPMVNTVEQARCAIRAAKYPPEGNRSLGGGMQMLNFAATAEEYYRRANDEIVVVLQTESPQGIGNAEAIYSLPGVDAIFVGPVDLRANLRGPDGSEPSDEQFEAAIAGVIAAGRRTGTPTGMHTMAPDAALARAAQGMQFLAIGSDLQFMTLKTEETLAALRPGKGKASSASAY
jgi:4-hydroxy-2-oxoheptanedioate aldolase